MIGPPPVAVGAFATKGRDLDLPGVMVGTADDDDAETLADRDRASRTEDLTDLFRSGARGDVVVARGAGHEEVADAPSRPERLVAGGGETFDNVDGEFAARIRHRVAAQPPGYREGDSRPETDFRRNWFGRPPAVRVVVRERTIPRKGRRMSAW